MNTRRLLAVTEQMIDNEIARLYAQGVRYILPIHLTANVFGDTAIYQILYDIVNYRENSRFFTVGCAQKADEIGYWTGQIPSVLNVFLPPGAPALPTPPSSGRTGDLLRLEPARFDRATGSFTLLNANVCSAPGVRRKT